MPSDPPYRTTFTAREGREIRQLLDQVPVARRAVRRMNAARLRHLGLPDPAGKSREQFEVLVKSGDIVISQADSTARAVIHRHPSNTQIFRVAVGVTGDSVAEDFDVFKQRYHWFGQRPQALASGAHLFVLAVDRWASAVVGLYEAVSAGADKLPDSPNPFRWPWAVGVQPLAAIPPPDAVRVDGQQGPQSGLPERIYDVAAIPHLYAAVADSPPPPGPQTLEHRVQELEPQDVVEDVLDAVADLERNARGPAVVDRALEIGDWTDEELAARAWYTGTGPMSHIENLVSRAINLELRGVLGRDYGSSPYVVREIKRLPLGVTYRRAGDREPAAVREQPQFPDPAALDKSTRRHMELQDRLADELLRNGIEPRSPGAWGPQFDIAFEHAGATYIVEVKTSSPVSPQQVRIGAGQVLEYCHVHRGHTETAVCPVLLLEGAPPDPWPTLSGQLEIRILRSDDLEGTLGDMLS